MYLISTIYTLFAMLVKFYIWVFFFKRNRCLFNYCLIRMYQPEQQQTKQTMLESFYCQSQAK